MTKCKSCGKNKVEDKYVLRERFSLLGESFLACIGLIFVGIISVKDLGIYGFFLFLFLSGAWFTLGLIQSANAETKKEILESLQEEKVKE